MSQISRPVQLALLAVIALAGIWFFALRSKPQSASTVVAVTAPAATAKPSAAAAAPGSKLPGGLGGLARAVDKANGAVALSNANAAALQRNSAAASSSSGAASTTPAPVSTTPPTASGTTAATGGTAAAAKPTTSSVATANSPATVSAAKALAKATAAAQAKSAPAVSPAITIKNQLAAGKTVALLFWNPQSIDDQQVHTALQSLATKHGSFVVYSATPGQVANYGSIVAAVQVLETPTILLMRGKSIESLTDLQDPSDLRQQINDLDEGGPGQAVMPTLTSYAVGTPRATYIKKENAVCRRLTKQAARFDELDPTTVAQAQADAKAAQSYLAGFRARLNAVPPPAADRGYLRGATLAIQRGVNEEVAAVFAARAGDSYLMHNLTLSAQTNYDLADQRLISYGLTDCAKD